MKSTTKIQCFPLIEIVLIQSFKYLIQISLVPIGTHTNREKYLFIRFSTTLGNGVLFAQCSKRGVRVLFFYASVDVQPNTLYQLWELFKGNGGSEKSGMCLQNAQTLGRPTARLTRVVYGPPAPRQSDVLMLRIS